MHALGLAMYELQVLWICYKTKICYRKKFINTLHCQNYPHKIFSRIQFPSKTRIEHEKIFLNMQNPQKQDVSDYEHIYYTNGYRHLCWTSSYLTTIPHRTTNIRHYQKSAIYAWRENIREYVLLCLITWWLFNNDGERSVSCVGGKVVVRGQRNRAIAELDGTSLNIVCAIR